MKNLLLLITLSFLLTGCWDKVELENRGFVNAIGIDKFNEENAEEAIYINKESSRFLIAMSLPSLDKLTGGKSEETDNKAVKLAANETLSAAMHLIDIGSSQKLYFGHTKLVILGRDLLEDETLFRETIDALERNREINRKIIVLATEDNIKETLECKAEGEPLIGMFVSNFYKNNADTISLALKQDLQGLIRQLRSTNTAIIPKIAVKDNEIKLGGAAVIKDFKLKGFLDDEKMSGYLLFKDKANGAQITIPYENSYIPLRIDKTKVNLNFSEDGYGLILQADFVISGNIEEYMFNNQKTLTREKLINLSEKFSEKIKSEVEDTFSYFQNILYVDGYLLKDYLRKHDYDLYKKYEEDWDTAFEETIFDPKVIVQITGTGSIK